LGQEAEIVAARRDLLAGEPLLLAGRDRPQIDLLAAEMHRGAHLARPPLLVLALHAEHALIPLSRGLDFAAVDDDVIESVDGKGHGSVPRDQCFVILACSTADLPSRTAARQRAIAFSTSAGSSTSSPWAPDASAILAKSV